MTIQQESCCQTLDDYLSKRLQLDTIKDWIPEFWKCDRCSEAIMNLEVDGDTAELKKLLEAEADGSYLKQLVNFAKGLYSTDSEHDRMPTVEFQANDQIDRYRIEKVIGEGAFGTVYQAQDPVLNRQVAIKVPHFLAPKVADAFIAEARNVAKLSFKGIVPIYDAGRLENNACYAVMKQIDGLPLDQTPLANFDHITSIALQVAQALEHAHQHGLVHCDVKPANILIDQSGEAWLTDLGLAVNLHLQTAEDRIAGTPSYMAPEQIRGESHRIDARTDVWSLGVTLFELLANQLPFVAENRSSLFEKICAGETPRLSEFADCPIELQRICEKCMSHDMSLRYASAGELASDLQAYRKPTGDIGNLSVTETPFVPRGLQAFSCDDAGFFLELLPGPRNRNGIPTSVQFWLDWIQSSTRNWQTSVGVIYGQSGSGKSSFLLAGVLPRLDDAHQTLVVDASHHNVEADLNAQLLQQFNVDVRWTLSRKLQWIKSRLGGPQNHVLIVIDQFEQWLSGQAAVSSAELSDALRMCDGENLSAIVVVREDFWGGISEFMRQLEISMVESVNAMRIPLVSEEHAFKVLEQQGRTLGCLPASGTALSTTQAKFLRRVIADLADHKHINLVVLSIYVELIKQTAWDIKNYQSVSRTDVGVLYLERIFGEATTYPIARQNRESIELILDTLMPRESSEIRLKSVPLKEISSGTDLPESKTLEILTFLDRELRLVTPSASESEQETRFCLTHDFLVKSIRKWMNQKSSQTWSGQAQARLSHLTDQWEQNQSSRFLPNPFELGMFYFLAPKAKRTLSNQKLIRAATLRFGLQVSSLVLALTLLVVGVWAVLRQARFNDEASAYASSVMTASIDRVTEIIDARHDQFHLATSETFQQVLAEESSSRDEQLRAHLALLPSDSKHAIPLAEHLFGGTQQEVQAIIRSLRFHVDNVSPQLWKAAREGSSRLHRWNAYLTLSSLDANSHEWTDDDLSFMADALVTMHPREQPGYYDNLRPLSKRLASHLRSIYRSQPGSYRAEFAASAMFEFFPDDLDLRIQLLGEAAPNHFSLIFDQLTQFDSNKASQRLLKIANEVGTTLEEASNEVKLIAEGKRKANAALGFLRLGGSLERLNRLATIQNPEALMQLIAAGPSAIEAPEQWLSFAATAEDPRFRYAALVTLGRMDHDQFSEGFLSELKQQLTNWFQQDPSVAVHSACEWLLIQLEMESDLVSLYERYPQKFAYDPSSNRDWFAEKVMGHWTTFAIIQPGTYTLGSPKYEDGRPIRQQGHADNEAIRKVKLGERIAVATTPVTLKQYLHYLNQALPDKVEEFQSEVFPSSPTGMSAVTTINWNEAIEFCSFLNRNKSSQRFCLPTEIIWEVACRAGSRTAFAFGNDRELVGQLGWFSNDKVRHAMTIRQMPPSPGGLFDMHGNVLEWCQGNFYDPNLIDTSSDKVAAATKPIRGGCWGSPVRSSRSSSRFGLAPETEHNMTGFRLAKELSFDNDKTH